MALAPQIETSRLKLVPFSAQHLSERYIAWLNDPEVVRFSDQRFLNHTLESCRTYWRSFEGTPHFFWAIEAQAWGVIGTITAYRDEVHRVSDIGILIGERAVWGKGFGSEAWNAVCHYLLLNGTRKVTAGTLEVNARMLAIMQKAGMREDGRRVGQNLFEGRAVDVIYTALFAES